MSRILNKHQHELLNRLARLGGSATSAELGGYTSGSHMAARHKSQVEGLVVYDRPGKVGGRWHITDAGRRRIEARYEG